MKRKPASTPLRKSKRRKAASKAQHTHEPQPSLPPQASLLGLPLELRLQILGYILPDMELIPHRDPGYGQTSHPTSRELGPRATQMMLSSLPVYEFREAQAMNAERPTSTISWVVKELLGGYIPLRQNLESCWPNILRVNHQLYHEAIPLMYKGKTFKAKIDEERLQFCGHEYSPYWSNQESFDLNTKVGKVESIQLALHYGCGSDDEDIRKLVLLTSSLANSLAEGKSLKRIQIDLKVFDWSEMDAVEWLDKTYEKDLKSILKPFHQLRNLESACVNIEGWNAAYDDDDDADFSAGFDSPTVIECQTSRDFTKYLGKMLKLVSGDSKVTQKQARIDLYLRYQRQHEFLFSGNHEFSGVFHKKCRARDELLERAWKTCERADLKAYERVLQDAKARWAQIQEQAEQRLGQLDMDLEDEQEKLLA